MRQLLFAAVAIYLVTACSKASDDKPTAKPKAVAGEGQDGEQTATATKPTAVLPTPTNTPVANTAKVKLSPLPWLYTEKAGFAAAKKAGKGVMIDFAATWCAPCEELDKTFATPGVREKLLAKFVPVKFDTTKQTAIDTARMNKHGVKQLPTVIFFGADGKEKHRLKDALKPAAMTALIATLKLK